MSVRPLGGETVGFGGASGVIRSKTDGLRDGFTLITTGADVLTHGLLIRRSWVRVPAGSSPSKTLVRFAVSPLPLGDETVDRPRGLPPSRRLP